MAKLAPVPGWFVLALTLVIGAHLIAICTTQATIDMMRAMTDFAGRVRANDQTLLPIFRVVTFSAGIAASTAYLWPILAYFRAGCPQPAPAIVQRRVISAPLVLAAIGFAGWLVGPVVFPIVTVWRFGRWSPELMSQHVLSPLVNGFLASTTAYLLTDLVFRNMVVRRVFPSGRLTDVSRAPALSVRGRLVVFLVAVAFVPIFTLFGLVRSAAVRLQAGTPVEEVVPALAEAGAIIFIAFLGLGTVLTLLLASSITAPLGCIAAVLRRVRAGHLDETVPVTSSDEVGVVQDGVNALVDTLKERERILRTFGRIVEPSVRDRLLAGDIQLGGEVRTATVFFCDLRGFTALAEHTPPAELVATLNEFFTVVTAWVRECGGFVDKFIGDALLVVFGLLSTNGPAAEAEGASAAIRCAGGLRERLATLNAARVATGRPALSAKVGIHTGEVVAGTIGARDRHEYTVIGDTVNVAARLQALCHEQHCDVLVSETTYRLAATRGAVGGDAPASDAISLRGRDEPVRVFAID
jgi:adenylate cyclase